VNLCRTQDDRLPALEERPGFLSRFSQIPSLIFFEKNKKRLNTNKQNRLLAYAVSRQCPPMDVYQCATEYEQFMFLAVIGFRPGLVWFNEPKPEAKILRDSLRSALSEARGLLIRLSRELRTFRDLVLKSSCWSDPNMKYWFPSSLSNSWNWLENRSALLEQMFKKLCKKRLVNSN
jgi:hypothetical protein